MRIVIEGNDENVSFAVESVAKNHFKISDLDNETFQERAIETLQAILTKVEESMGETQEE